MATKAQIETLKENEFTPENAAAKGSRGGVKSGQTRRKKKKLKDSLKTILELEPSERNKQKMASLGIAEDDMTNEMLIAVAAFQKAAGGDVRAMEFVRDMTGQETVSKLDRAKIKLLNAQAKQIEAELALADEEDESVVIVNDCE